MGRDTPLPGTHKTLSNFDTRREIDKPQDNTQQYQCRKLIYLKYIPTISPVIMSEGSMSSPTDGKSKLSFSMNDSIYEIESAKDMSTSEIQAVWYTQDEYAKIRTSYQKIIQKMESGTHDESKYCSVGLLRMTQDEQNMCNTRKQLAHDAVKREQRAQQEEGIRNPSIIAEVYIESIGSTCHMAAAMSALRLANDVSKNCTIPDKDIPNGSSSEKQTPNRLNSFFNLRGSSKRGIGFGKVVKNRIYGRAA